MLIDQAHIEFEVSLDKRYTSQAPELPPEVIDYFMNESQSRFVKTRYAENNIYRKGFEENQKRIDDLRTLVVTEDVEVLPVPYEDDNYVQVDLSALDANYWFFLRGRALVTKEGCGSSYNRLKLVQQDDLEKVLDDPFNAPTYERPVMYFENGNIIVVSDNSFTVDGFKVTFLKSLLK